MRGVVVIGYSGHAYVVIDILQAAGFHVSGYCEKEEKSLNPLGLNYLGSEKTPHSLSIFSENDYFIAIGNNKIRSKIYDFVSTTYPESNIVNAIHPSSIISKHAYLADGVMIGPGSVINAFTDIGTGCICNSGSVVEHECKLGSFVHIAPNATLAGNVTVGNRTFIGAGAVIRERIKIGADVIIGAGCVVIKDVPDGAIVVGNPGRLL